MNTLIHNNQLYCFFIMVCVISLLCYFSILYKKMRIYVYISVFILVPFLFITFLNSVYRYVPGEVIGEKGDWIGFAGGYIGAIFALGGIWWQIKTSSEIKDNDEKKEILEYIKFIVDFNLNNLNNKDIEYDVESMLFLKKKIITLSDSYEYLLNFNENNIQSNINIYIKLNILDDIYKILSKIKSFSKHFNIFFINYNKNVAILLKLTKINNNENSKKLYHIFSKMSDIINSYNSAKIYKKIGYIKSLEIQSLEIEKLYQEYKKLDPYFAIKELDDFSKIFEDTITIDDINIKKSIQLSKIYIDVLNSLILSYEEFDFENKENTIEKLNLISYNMSIISGNLNEIKKDLILLKRKIEQINY